MSINSLQVHGRGCESCACRGELAKGEHNPLQCAWKADSLLISIFLFFHPQNINVKNWVQDEEMTASSSSTTINSSNIGFQVSTI